MKNLLKLEPNVRLIPIGMQNVIKVYCNQHSKYQLNDYNN